MQHDHWDKSKLDIFNGGKLQMIKWSINKHRSCFFNNFFEDFFSSFEKQNALLFLNLIKIIPVYKNNLIYILYNLYNTNTFLRFFSYMCHLKNKGFDVCCRIPSKVLNPYLKYTPCLILNCLDLGFCLSAYIYDTQLIFFAWKKGWCEVCVAYL